MCNAELKMPDQTRYIDFTGDMGTNGQYDEIALELFEEDNGEYADCDDCFRRYCDQLQANADSRRA